MPTVGCKQCIKCGGNAASCSCPGELFICKCGREVEIDEQIADIHWVVCPACGRRGNFIKLEE